jgi:hypothetical protein
MEVFSSGEKWTTRAIQACIVLIALSAPISIAATQTAWALAILFWLVRLVFVRPRMRFASLDIAVLAFVGLSLVSSVFSYEPRVSLGKMAAVSLVSIAYVVSEYVGRVETVRRVVAVLLAASFAACLYTFAAQAIGKNLKTVRLTPESPLRSAGVDDGYTILKANGIDVHSPDELWTAISSHLPEGFASLMVYRHELVDTYKLSTADLHGVNDLGILEWSRSRDMRAAGFFGHYVTFAEALQLVASLALGLLIMTPAGMFRHQLLLAGGLVAYLAALLLSLTRASWASFAVSAAVMIGLAASRKTLLICVGLAVPLAIAGLFYLQAKRQVGFVDTSDNSTTWRLMVWREGVDVLTSSPRHLLVGIGMDSIKTHWKDWHMFDDGRQPIGHLHSTPLQLAFERGVPALNCWLKWLAIYLRVLWRGFRDKTKDRFERGLLLGALGGTIGLFTSGLVHYNWGDSEVVMIFYLIMGLALAILHRGESAHGRGIQTDAR